MRAAVVILNWNTVHYLERWLPGLLGSISPADEVIVADNGSADGSLQMMERRFPAVRTIDLGKNLGFTGGYNAALSQIDADYYVLANSDVDFEPGWLDPLVRWMDGHPRCAACGPKIHALSADGGRTSRFEYAGAAGGFIDRLGFPFCRGRVLGRTEEDRGQYDGTDCSCLWVSGACMMVRSSVWKAIGGLDDRFFAHMEEIDFCWRAALAGYSVSVVPESVVWHLGGGTLPQGSPFKLKLNFRNNLLLLDNNLTATVGVRRASFIIAARKFIDLLVALAYFVTLRPSLAGAVLSAHREYASMRRPRGGNGTTKVKGYMELCIVPLALVKGGRIFSYLKKYENNH